jgi:Protein of unknown function (DUF3455)
VPAAEDSGAGARRDSVAAVIGSEAHTGEGRLARITTIQRIRTEAGLPPNASECKVSANGKESRSAYSADYDFHAPAQR